MSSSNTADNDFIVRLTEITEANLTNPQFGVSMLASELGMSRSNLHRKVDALLKISASQFISHTRLKKAKELLRHTSDTVSEVAYKVGFSNVSYFIKCFHEFYGYSPGQVGERDSNENLQTKTETINKKLRKIILLIISIAAITIVLFFVFNPFSGKHKEPEKTIAILPPIYSGNDSTDLYVLDGIMDYVINNLSMIKDVKKVIPWTSVIKYRKITPIIPEIAKELNVNYIVESIGMTHDDNISLNVKLINVKEHKPIWVHPFKEKAEDIFMLQTNISNKIANGIETTITPDEEEWINKIPTVNDTAYDYYLKGREMLYQQVIDSTILENAAAYFRKALEYDDKFAKAYADLARVYYLADTDNFFPILQNADKALCYDPKSPMSYVAKAYYYMEIKDFEMANWFLEKALEINPNFYYALLSLQLVHSNYNLANPGKSLKYRLKALGLINPDHNIELSWIYMITGSGFRDVGLREEAEQYFNKSIETHPENLKASFCKSELYYDMEKDPQQSLDILLPLYKKDSTNSDILRGLFLHYYRKRDYNEALKIHNKRIEHNNFPFGDAGRVGFILSEMGNSAISKEYIDKFFNYCQRPTIVYQHYKLAEAYAIIGDTQNALKYLKIFSQKEYHNFWVIQNLKKEPIFDNIRDLTEFQEILSGMETKFWANHEKIKKMLKEEGLL